jgi:hypothetical protein
VPLPGAGELIAMCLNNGFYLFQLLPGEKEKSITLVAK